MTTKHSLRKELAELDVAMNQLLLVRQHLLLMEAFIDADESQVEAKHQARINLVMFEAMNAMQLPKLSGVH